MQMAEDFDRIEYLLDVDNIPEIPENIDEKFREVLNAFETYASHAHLPSEQLENEKALIERAYHFAYKAHIAQKRKTGEMYIIHPIATAEILAELEVDAESLAAALLHDTIEDTEVDTEMLEQVFGSTITLLVEGVTKLNQIAYVTKEEVQASNVQRCSLP